MFGGRKQQRVENELGGTKLLKKLLKRVKRKIVRVIKQTDTTKQPDTNQKAAVRNSTVKKVKKVIKKPYEEIGQNWKTQDKPVAFMFGFNPWKREHMSKFFAEYRTAYVFGKANIDALKEAFDSEPEKIFIVWGFKEPEEVLAYAEENNVTLYRVEDGFVRSVGLGAAHTLPLSIAADSRTLYFNSREPSDLEVLLETRDFSQDELLLEQAKRCMNMLINMGVSKYNFASRKNIEEIYGEKTKRRILVIGQVEDDASIRYGCAKPMTNNDLVWAAYNENPDAEIIYKPHPDVLGGYRKAYSDPMAVSHIAKVVTEPLSLVDAFETIDHVYTITSLAGFEALIRGIKVTCFGAPFYSGWGLTDDRQPCERRTRKRTVEELFAAAYMLYPRYLHPETDELIDLEEAIHLLYDMIAQNTFASGVEKKEKKQFEAAEALLRQAVKQCKDRNLAIEWNLELIEVLHELEKYEEMLETSKEVLKKCYTGSRQAILHHRIALAYKGLGEYALVEEHLQTALSLDRSFQYLNTMIDFIWETQGPVKALFSYVEEALASSEDISQELLLKYAAIYHNGGQYTEATNVCRSAEVKNESIPYLALSAAEGYKKKVLEESLSFEEQVYDQLMAMEGTFENLVKKAAGSICIVGNANSHEAEKGEFIDQHELVIRVNDFTTDYPAALHTGTKTNVWFKKGCNPFTVCKENLTEHEHLDLVLLSDVNAIHRDRNGKDMFVSYLRQGKSVQTYPQTYYSELISLLGHRPSEEMMIVYWVYKIQGPLSKEVMIGLPYDSVDASEESAMGREKKLYESLLQKQASRSV